MQFISLPQRLARGIYSLIFGCLLPVIILRLLAKSLKQPLYRQHLLERLGYGTRHSGHSIWIHAVSVGEMKVAVLAYATNWARVLFPWLITSRVVRYAQNAAYTQPDQKGNNV